MLGMLGKHTSNERPASIRWSLSWCTRMTYDKPGMYKMEDVEAYRKKLTDGSWNCFIHTRDKDGSDRYLQPKASPDNARRTTW